MPKQYELKVGHRYIAVICTYSSVKNYMEFSVVEIGSTMIKVKNATGDHWFKLSDFERDSGFEYDGFHIIEELPQPTPTTPTTFQDENNFEFAEWASHSDWTYVPSKKKWYNEEDEEKIAPRTTKELFSSFKQLKELSGTIKAGAGTANDVGNDWLGRVEFQGEKFLKPQPQNNKERIEVEVKIDNMFGSQISVRPKRTGWRIPNGKSDAIKQAIEQVLNS